jgi:NAD(P)-dependent dehydrogenase (short-subunit alcohol dehydrogenase family)
LVGNGLTSAYTASKHGVAGLTKSAALDFAQHGIRVNVVCPGLIDTPMMSPALSDPQAAAQMTARYPMGRVGRPDEIAAAVVWLCSDAASFVTGHLLTIDGGLLAR